jgi:O-antigen/teichoic acid export membrane protein
MTKAQSSNSAFRDTASTLTRGSFYTMLINGVSALLTLGLHVALARALGHENYSDYAYALTWLTILALPGVLGMDTAAQRYVSSYQAVADWPAMRGFMRQSARLVLGSSLLLVALCAIALAVFSGQMRPELAQVFWLATFALPFTALLLLGVAILRGLRSPILAALPRLIVRPALLGAAILLIRGFVGDDLPSQVGMLVDLAATGAALALAVIFIRRCRPQALLSCAEETKTKEWLSVSLSMLGIALMQLLVRSTDTILIGFFHGTATSGPYSAANRIALLAAFGLMAVNAVLPPLIARYHVRGEKRDLQRLVTLAARVTFLFSVIATAVLVLLREPVLAAFGSEFSAASTALVILCGGQLVNALTGSVGFVLSMTGNHRVVLTTLIWTTAGHAVLCVVLIPTHGIEGAAWATASAIGISNIVLALRCRYSVSIDPSIFGLGRNQSAT